MRFVVKFCDLLVKKAKQLSWYSLALVIVMVFAGPEFFIVMELTAMVELMGASTFCIFYLSAIKAYFEPYFKKLSSYLSRLSDYLNDLFNFEGDSFFILQYKDYSQMPAMLIHAIPSNTFVLGYLIFISSFAILSKIV